MDASRPRVLFVTKRLGVGGTERHISQLLPQLKSNAIDPALFVLERGGELEADLIAKGIDVAGGKSRGIVGLLRASFSLARYIRSRRPDIVHFFLPEPYLVGAVVSAFCGVRTTIMSRRSLTHYQRGRPWLRWIEGRLHRRTTALIGNSKPVVNELMAESGDPTKVGLIYNGIELPSALPGSTRDAMRRQLNISDSTFVMVIVANLIPYKGHADLIAALASIKSRMPEYWCLILAGRDEGIGAALQEQARSAGILDKLRFVGATKDVPALLSAADLGLLVSHQEGFSNALLEVMAAELPVIATAIGGNLDAVEDRISGRLVPVAAPLPLGEAIVELAHNPDMRQRLGAAAKQRVTDMFSQSMCVARYLRLYRGLWGRQSSPVQAVIDGSVPLESPANAG